MVIHKNASYTNWFAVVPFIVHATSMNLANVPAMHSNALLCLVVYYVIENSAHTFLAAFGSLF